MPQTPQEFEPSVREAGDYLAGRVKVLLERGAGVASLAAEKASGLGKRLSKAAEELASAVTR